MEDVLQFLSSVEAQQPGLQDVTGSDAVEHEPDEEADEFRDVHMTLGQVLADVREQRRNLIVFFSQSIVFILFIEQKNRILRSKRRILIKKSAFERSRKHR